jgi:hypothetical protein
MPPTGSRLASPKWIDREGTPEDHCHGSVLTSGTPDSESTYGGVYGRFRIHSAASVSRISEACVASAGAGC